MSTSSSKRTSLRHIKKKFSQEKLLTEAQFVAMEQKVEQVNIKNARPVPDGYVPFLAIEGSKKVIAAFHFSANGHHYYMPEPNLVVIHFDRAYFMLKAIQTTRKEMFEKLNSGTMNEDIANELYRHFGSCMEFIVSLFTAIEAQMNMLVPESYKHVDEQRRFSMVYDAKQIQEFLPLDAKLKEVIPTVTGKRFQTAHPVPWDRLMNLKEIRDMIIHPKIGQGKTTPHDYFFKRLLHFKYEEAFLAVKDYLNFYSADGNLIHDCDCGKDF